MAVAKRVQRLAAMGIGNGAPCCAHCAGVVLDINAADASPRQVLAKKRANPVSIAAYRAAREMADGKTVEIMPRGDRAPMLVIDRAPVDPLEDYEINDCGCGG